MPLTFEEWRAARAGAAPASARPSFQEWRAKRAPQADDYSVFKQGPVEGPSGMTLKEMLPKLRRWPIERDLSWQEFVDVTDPYLARMPLIGQWYERVVGAPDFPPEDGKWLDRLPLPDPESTTELKSGKL